MDPKYKPHKELLQCSLKEGPAKVRCLGVQGFGFWGLGAWSLGFTRSGFRHQGLGFRLFTAVLSLAFCKDSLGVWDLGFYV